MERIAFALGWLGVFNLIFWIAIFVVWGVGNKKKFWNEKTFFVVYVFGWIYLVFILFMLFMFIFFSHIFLWFN